MFLVRKKRIFLSLHLPAVPYGVKEKVILLLYPVFSINIDNSME